MKARLTTIRRQLVLLYLGVLALLLLGLGIFQSINLTSYLNSTTSESMRESARSQLGVLSPCYINSDADLRRNAQTLAILMGSRETAVKIVTPSGQTLADHGAGGPGQYQALNLSANTIRKLIASTDPSRVPQPSPVRAPSCRQIGPGIGPEVQHHAPITGPSALSQGNLLLLAIPLGPNRRPVGYALLGRSMAGARATIQRSDIVFALGALVALLLAALVAVPLINRALRPLRRVAETAGAIAAGDLQQRANLAHSPDEIGQLGSAFDTMVDRLQSALTVANQSEERMRRFLADASHELRTPLTALRGTTQVLLRQGGSGRPDIDQALNAVHDETLRLSRLVNDLLTLSRLDEGQEPLEPQLVVLRPFLETFLQRYGGAWPDRTIRFDVEDVDGTEVYVDPEALRRILTNLVDNAARYSTAGTPITLAAHLPGETTATVEVVDEGPGLSAADAARAFERFYRGKKGRSRQSGGSGLGLAIVDALVKESGGEIAVDTAPGQGTTVAITLPRSPAPSQERDARPATAGVAP